MTTAYVDPQSIHNPTAGSAIPATWGDTVRNDLEFFASPPGCRVYRTNAQTGLATGVWTTITFPTADATEQWDTDAFHSGSSNTSRLTMPFDGVYLLTGGIRWDTNTTGNRSILFTKNGTQVGAQQVVAANSEGTAMSITAEVEFAAGQYVELIAYQGSGGNRDTVIAGAFSVFLAARWVSR